MKPTTDEIRDAKRALWVMLRAIPADHAEQNADLYEALKTDQAIREEAWREVEGAGNWVEQMEMQDRQRRIPLPPEYTGEW